MKFLHVVFGRALVFTTALLILVHSARAQSGPDSIVQITAEAQGLSLVSQLPPTGTFWLVTSNVGSITPMPVPSFGSAWPVYQLAEGQFLVDASAGQVSLKVHGTNLTLEAALSLQAGAIIDLINRIQDAAVSRDLVQVFGRSAMEELDEEEPPVDTFLIDTNVLWLEITNVSAGWAHLNLHRATNQVYAIWATTNLLTPWLPVLELWPVGDQTNALPFTLPTPGQQSLYVRAQDWTDFDGDGDSLPDWWEYHWFGTFAYSDTNVDANGSTFLDDYNNNTDPNPIQFTIEVTNNYVSTPNAALHLDVTAGVPYFYTVTVDDTNYLAATSSWTAYTSADITASLGTNEGWHTLWVALKGLPGEAAVTWVAKRLKLDTLPPQLTITNPASTVNVPLIQVQGFSPEDLSSISYDLSNAVVNVTNQQVLVVNQCYDAAAWEFTTNTFQAFDVLLTNGLNTLTLHATDLAGNVMTTNASFTLDYSTATNPVVQLTWPQDGMRLCGDSFTLRGTVDDVSAAISATITDTNGNTSTVSGVVERTGVLWVDNLPLAAGTNWLTLNVTNAAGRSNTTSIVVVKSAMNVTLNSMAGNTRLWQPTVTVQGTVSDASYAVWVNGVLATVTPDGGDPGGTWSADNVPVTPGGVASFDMTLYPPDEAPDADLSGLGVNPRTAGAQDGGVDTDKPWGQYMIATRQDLQDDTERHQQFYNQNPDGTKQNTVHTHSHNQNRLNYYWLPAMGGEGTNSNSSLEESWDDLHGGTYSKAVDTAGFWPMDIDWTGDGWGNAVFYVNGNITGTVYSGWSVWTQLADEHCHVVDGYPGASSWDRPVSAISVDAPYLREQGDANETYSRTADTFYHLRTGGRAVPGRQSLWCLTGGAEELLGKRWTPPYYFGIPRRGIPVTQVMMGELGKLKADGKLWVVLPDNADLDITPTVDGKDFYTFGVDAQDYKLKIMANSSVVLDPDVVVDGATNFWVGQNMTFGGGFQPSLPESPEVTFVKWTFDGIYVNDSIKPYPNGSVNYFLNADHLNDPTTQAWWVAGNDSLQLISVSKSLFTEELAFANGQHVTLSTRGMFDIIRPQTHVTTSTGIVAVDDNYGTYPLALHYGIPDSTPGITFSNKVEITGGSIKWLQVINSASIGFQLNNGSWIYPRQGNNASALDNQDPYGSYLDDVNTTADSPASAPHIPNNLKTIRRTDYFCMWLEFKPANGIWVPLRFVPWNWMGNAIRSGTNWTLTSNPDPDPDPSDSDTTVFPKWTNVATNYSTH